jgi:hypothetical protein
MSRRVITRVADWLGPRAGQDAVASLISTPEGCAESIIQRVVLRRGACSPCQRRRQCRGPGASASAHEPRGRRSRRGSRDMTSTVVTVPWLAPSTRWFVPPWHGWERTSMSHLQGFSDATCTDLDAGVRRRLRGQRYRRLGPGTRRCGRSRAWPLDSTRPAAAERRTLGDARPPAARGTGRRSSQLLEGPKMACSVGRRRFHVSADRHAADRGTHRGRPDIRDGRIVGGWTLESGSIAWSRRLWSWARHAGYRRCTRPGDVGALSYSR